MKSSDSELSTGAAWYWWLGAFVNLGLGAALLVDAVGGSHETEGGMIVSVIAASSLLFFGSAMALVCRRYALFVEADYLVYRITPFINRRYHLKGVKDVRINGPYLSLDYGVIPKPAVLLLCPHRMRLFYQVAERSHDLLPGTLSQRPQ